MPGGATTRIAAKEKRFVVRADEKLTAFLELEAAIRAGTAIATRHRTVAFDIFRLTRKAGIYRAIQDALESVERAHHFFFPTKARLH